MGEKHTVKWKYITFFDAQGRAVDLKSLDQLPLLKEMEVFFGLTRLTRLVQVWSGIGTALKT